MTERPPDRHSPPRGRPVLDAGMLVVPLLVSIPIWAALGVAFVLLYLERPLSETEAAALTVAAAAEIILLRHAWRRSRRWRAGLIPRTPTRFRVALAPLRRPELMAGAAAAFLHYYYWDVQLQIASLPAVTVFVAAQG